MKAGGRSLAQLPQRCPGAPFPWGALSVRRGAFRPERLPGSFPGHVVGPLANDTVIHREVLLHPPSAWPPFSCCPFAAEAALSACTRSSPGPKMHKRLESSLAPEARQAGEGVSWSRGGAQALAGEPGRALATPRACLLQPAQVCSAFRGEGLRVASRTVIPC